MSKIAVKNKKKSVRLRFITGTESSKTVQKNFTKTASYLKKELISR
jgi:hypothetical protein